MSSHQAAPAKTAKAAILGNMGWMLADRVCRLFAGLFVTIAVARYLGPENYGELAYAAALVGVLQTCASLGIDAIVVRKFSTEDESTIAQTMGTTIGLRTLTSSILFLTCIAISLITHPGDYHALALVAIFAAGFFFQIADVLDLFFQSRSESRKTVIARTTALILASVLKINLILVEASVYQFAMAQLLETAVGSYLMIRKYRQATRAIRLSFSGVAAFELMKEGWPLFCVALAVAAYTRIDQVLLGLLASPAEVGKFAAALSLSQLWAMIPVIVSASVFPYLAKLYNIDRSKYDNLLQIGFTLALYSSIFIVMGVEVLGPWFIKEALGEKYRDAVQILQVHVIGNIAIFLGVAQHNALIIEGRSKISLWKTLTGAAIGIGLNLLLIPKFGAVGAAFAAVAAQFTSSILANLVWSKGHFHMQVAAIHPAKALIFAASMVKGRKL